MHLLVDSMFTPTFVSALQPLYYYLVSPVDLILLSLLLLLEYVPGTVGVTGVATSHGIAPVAKMLPTPAIDAIAAVPASALTQLDLPGYFQTKLDNLNINI